MFGLDSPLSLFPPGIDPGKLYNPLMEMSDPRSMHPHPHGPYLKKKNKCKFNSIKLKIFILFVEEDETCENVKMYALMRIGLHLKWSKSLQAFSSVHCAYKKFHEPVKLSAIQSIC